MLTPTTSVLKKYLYPSCILVHLFWYGFLKPVIHTTHILMSLGCSLQCMGIFCRFSAWAQAVACFLSDVSLVLRRPSLICSRMDVQPAYHWFFSVHCRPWHMVEKLCGTMWGLTPRTLVTYMKRSFHDHVYTF